MTSPNLYIRDHIYDIDDVAGWIGVAVEVILESFWRLFPDSIPIDSFFDLIALCLTLSNNRTMVEE